MGDGWTAGRSAPARAAVKLDGGAAQAGVMLAIFSSTQRLFTKGRRMSV